MSPNTLPNTPDWPSYEEYCRQIDMVAQVVRLDPNHDDIQKFKEVAPKLIADRDERGPQFFLNMLLPYFYGVRADDGSVTILPGNLVLQPWTIANWYCPGFADHAVKIVINSEDTRVYAPNDEHLLTFATRISPHRNTTDTTSVRAAMQSYWQAATLVHGITGARFTWKKRLTSHTDTIIISRGDADQAWQAEFRRRLTLALPRRESKE